MKLSENRDVGGRHGTKTQAGSRGPGAFVVKYSTGDASRTIVHVKVPPPVVRSKEEACNALRSKLPKTSTTSIVLPILTKVLVGLYDIQEENNDRDSNRDVFENHGRNDDLDSDPSRLFFGWSPRTVTTKMSGVYIGGHSSSNLNAEDDNNDVESLLSFDNLIRIKYGMARQMLSQTQKQDFAAAAAVLDLDVDIYGDKKNMTGVNIRTVDLLWKGVESIKAERHRLFGLYYHPEREADLDRTVMLQVCEGMFACIRSPSSGIIGERLVQEPSLLVQNTININRMDAIVVSGTAVAPGNGAESAVPPDVIEFLQGIPDNGIQNLYSWSTLKTDMHILQLKSAYLRSKLHTAPKEGGFVKNHCTIRLLGSKTGGFVDSVPVSPRQVQINHVLTTLKPLLRQKLREGDAFANDDKIRQALSPLQGENYSHHVKPLQAQLGEGARDELSSMLETVPLDNVIDIEYSTFNALNTEFPSWTEQNFRFDCEVRYGNIRFFHSSKGQRIVVHPAWYVMFSEETTLRAIFNTATSYCQYQVLASGNLDVAKVREERLILQAFLMNLSVDGNDPDAPLGGAASSQEYDDNDDIDDVDDGNETPTSTYRLARRLYFPQGYLVGPKPNVAVVSKQLNIGYLEVLFLRHAMMMDDDNNDNCASDGQDLQLFNQLLIAHGLLLGGQQSSSPVEVNWVCPGPAGIGDLPAESCTTPTENGQSVGVCCILCPEDQDHPYKGGFYCRQCVRKVHRRARIYLENLDSPKQHQTACLNKLQGLRMKNAEHQEAWRKRQITEHGLHTVLMTERQKRIGESAAAIKDGEQREQKRLKSAAHESQRRANGGKTKASGTNRKDTKTVARYDIETSRLMDTAMLMTTMTVGVKSFRANVAISVLDHVLLHRGNEARYGVADKRMLVKHTTFTDGSRAPVYLACEYDRVMDKYFCRDKMTLTIKDEYLPKSDSMAKAQRCRSEIEAKGKHNGMKPQNALVQYIFCKTLEWDSESK
jgi:hypothetical protein